MDDYNDFYMKSIASGAQPDEFGGVRHTTASMMQMQMNQEHQDFFNQNQDSHNSIIHQGHRIGKSSSNNGFWKRFFNGW